VAAEDSRAAILEATGALLAEIVAANGIDAADVASAIFTATPDLTQAYPAEAARQMGWTDTALLCAQEMAVRGSLGRCIRVLLHWETGRPAGAITHVYQNGAEVLRPDRAARARGEPGSD
jgi:chorismate mutase